MKKSVNNFIFFVVIIMFAVACQDRQNGNVKEKIDIVATPKIATENKNILYNKILENGDTTSYDNLRYDLFLNNDAEELLYYSIYMANKYKYPQAYCDVYSILINDRNIDSIDVTTKDLAIYYLLLAYEKGNIEAKEHLIEIYAKQENFPKSANYCK